MTGTIPANVEAEAALLGALLIETKLIDGAADILSPADFHEPLHARIFETAVHLAQVGKLASALSLKPYFEDDESLKDVGGFSYIVRLTADGQGLLAPRELAQQISDLAQRRRMQAGLNQAAIDCGDMLLSTPEIIAQADAALALNGDGSIHQPTAGEAMDELVAGFGQPHHGVECFVIPSLDRLIGPIQPKQVIIVAARPGMGKTALALSYALGAARKGHGVLFVSLEMSSRELAVRMAADQCFMTEGGVPYSAIRDGKLNDWQNRRVIEAASYVRGLPFNIVDAGFLTTGRLGMLVRRHARRLAARGQKLELVVVDYLQLLSPDSKGRSNYESVSEISRALKAMAKDQGVGVMALAQLSRDVEKRQDRRPQLSDLRDSGQIEQDADAVLFLLRNEYYLHQAEPDLLSPDRIKWETAIEASRGQIEFILAKRRNGVTGSATGQFHGAYQAVR